MGHDRLPLACLKVPHRWAMIWKYGAIFQQMETYARTSEVESVLMRLTVKNI